MTDTDQTNSCEIYGNESKKTFKKERVQLLMADLSTIAIILSIFIFVLVFLNPKIRYFTCEESDIFFPYRKDTIPYWAVGICATFMPLIAIVIVEMFNVKTVPFKKNAKRKETYFICVFHAISLFALGISIVLLLTEIGKKWVGRLRPHFIAVCKPDFSKINCTSKGLTGDFYNSIDTSGHFCTGDPGDVREASFIHFKFNLKNISYFD